MRRNDKIVRTVLAHSLLLCVMHTPSDTGADANEVEIPYDFDGTLLRWIGTRLTLRVQTPGGSPSIRIERLLGGEPLTVCELTLDNGTYEKSISGVLCNLTSGDRIRFNVVDAGTAQNWTVALEITDIDCFMMPSAQLTDELEFSDLCAAQLLTEEDMPLDQAVYVPASGERAACIIGARGGTLYKFNPTTGAKTNDWARVIESGQTPASICYVSALDKVLISCWNDPFVGVKSAYPDTVPVTSRLLMYVRPDDLYVTDGYDLIANDSNFYTSLISEPDYANPNIGMRQMVSYGNRVYIVYAADDNSQFRLWMGYFDPTDPLNTFYGWGYFSYGSATNNIALSTDPTSNYPVVWGCDNQMGIVVGLNLDDNLGYTGTASVAGVQTLSVVSNGSNTIWVFGSDAIVRRYNVSNPSWGVWSSIYSSPMSPVASIDTGRTRPRCFHMTYDPDRKLVYAPCYSDNTVIVIDELDNSFEVKIGYDLPYDIVIAGSKVFAVQQGDKGLKEIVLSPRAFTKAISEAITLGDAYGAYALTDGGVRVSSSITLLDAIVTDLQLAVPSGLLLMNESSDFDSGTDGATISTWSDLSGNSRDWSAINAPFIDKTTTLNGHATVRFSNASQTYMQQGSKWMPASPAGGGLELMIVYKMNPYPPTDMGCVFAFNHGQAAAGHHQPYQDQHFYEGFGRADRPDLGIPGENPGSWLLYDIASKADNSQWTVWMNDTQFYNVTNGYTFSVAAPSTNYTLGTVQVVPPGTYNYFTGNVAAIYMWDHYLSDTERTNMRNYLKSKWNLPGL